jgi:hypothetical protein
MKSGINTMKHWSYSLEPLSFEGAQYWKACPSPRKEFSTSERGLRSPFYIFEGMVVLGWEFRNLVSFACGCEGGGARQRSQVSQSASSGPKAIQ